MILSVCPNPSIDTYAWLDDFDPGGVNRIKKLQEYPGGKGVHVALALAELGTGSKLMATWGGNTGKWIREKCSVYGINCRGIALTENNRKCYTFRSEKPGFDNSELLEPGPSFSSADWEAFALEFKREIDDASIICMSGSWPGNAPGDAYAQLIAIAKKQHINTILDCSGSQLENALKIGFFGIHLNEIEAENLCGSKDIHELLKMIGDKVKLVAFTRGKKGLILAFNGQLVTANVEVDKVVSTVGSGDCLTAGIAYAISKNLSVEEIAAWGVACGAANCLTESLGMLNEKIVHQLLPKVNVKKFKDEK